MFAWCLIYPPRIIFGAVYVARINWPRPQNHRGYIIPNRVWEPKKIKPHLDLQAAVCVVAKAKLVSLSQVSMAMGKYSPAQIATIARNVLWAGPLVYSCVTVIPVYNDYSKLKKKAME